MEDLEKSCPKEQYITSKKIQTFSFVPPKSDIFLDLNPQKSRNTFDKNNRIEIITLERPTPKLIYELEEEPLQSRIKNQLHHYASKCQTFFQQSNSRLCETLRPKLIPVKFWTEVFLSSLIVISSAPLILIFLSSLLAVRFFTTLYLKARYKDEFELLKGADAVWGIQSFANHNCFISIYTLQGECSLEKIRNRIKTSVIDRTDSGNLICDRMRQLLVSKCGFLCWQKFPEFNIKDHVKFLKEIPNMEMPQDEMFNEIRKFVDQPLSPSRPQWEVLVVPKFTGANIETLENWNLVDEVDDSSKHYLLIWRMSHSIMDEISLANMIQKFVADNTVKIKPVPAVDPSSSTPEENINTWSQKLILYAEMLSLGSRTFLKAILRNEWNCFHGTTLTGPKTLMWSRPISIQSLKQIKNVLNTNTTAVLLSAFGGSLRSLALRKNLPVPEKITGGATCSVLPYQGDLSSVGPCNKTTRTSFKLKLDFKCSKERLLSASDSVEEFYNPAEIIKNFNLLKVIGLSPVCWIGRILNRIQDETFLISNIDLQGSTSTKICTMFQGDKVVDITTWNSITGNTAIGISLFNYAGKIRAGVIADASVFPNQADVPAIIQDFEGEILELAKICGIPEDFVFLESI